jgi:hypothetical protein
VAESSTELSCRRGVLSADAPLEWTGTDAFSSLADRSSDTPLPLPALTTLTRVVLVRHGQSTWNAAGRIQGSSDLSVLTVKGEAQAQATRATVGAPLRRIEVNATNRGGED